MIDSFTTQPQGRYSKGHLNWMKYQFQKTTNYCLTKRFKIINPELTGTSSNDPSCYLNSLCSFYCCIFSSFQKVAKSVKSTQKTMKRESYDVLTGRSHMLSRFLHEWPMTTGSLPAILLFVVTWVEKWPAKPESKAVNVMGIEMTNIFICAFKVSTFEILLSGSFFNAGDWEQ